MLTARYPSGPGEFSRWRTTAPLPLLTISTKFRRFNDKPLTNHIAETCTGRIGISVVWATTGLEQPGVAHTDEMTSLLKPHLLILDGGIHL